MEKVFPFYSGPMLSCPEAKGCRQKDSKLGVFVSTEMGILGSDGDNFPFYSGPIMSGMSNLKTPSCVFWVSTELGMLRPKGF